MVYFTANYMMQHYVRRFTRIYGLWFLFVLVMFAIGACGQQPSMNENSDSTGSLSTSPIIDGGVAATIAFPQQSPVEGERIVAASLVTGQLKVVGECLKVNEYVIVWPPDVTLHIGIPIEVRNTAQQVVARVGDNVRLGGGTLPTRSDLEGLTPPLREMPPNNCSGPYWIVGNILP